MAKKDLKQITQKISQKVTQLLFAKKQESLVGIDISATSVKLLEFSRIAGGKYKVESFASAPIPKDAIINHEFKDIEAISNAIHLVKNRARSQAKYAAISISGASIVSKVIRIDGGLSKSELENQVFLEAGNYVPFPIEEVSLDYLILKEPSSEEDPLEILLVASRTENVASRADILEEAGFKAKVVDVDSYAMGRACLLMSQDFSEEQKRGNIALIDIGKLMTNFAVLSNFSIVYTHEEEFGGNQLNEHIQNTFDCSIEDASFAKKYGYFQNSETKEPDERIFTACQELIANHIHHLLQFYIASGNPPIDYIILSGGSCGIPKLAEYLTEQLKTPTKIADPFAHMEVASHINKDELKSMAPSLLVCCGLAMRRFDE